MKFKSVTFKNFLSYGAAPTTVRLDDPGITAITGKNGSGKSTIPEAICFALYGRAYRKINRAELVNSVNGKDCWVALDFEHNGHSYRVERGINPNVLQIYDDGKLIPAPADVRDYQNRLQSIIGISYKTFPQIIILGAAAFVPFMQLSTDSRREVIDNLLDINILKFMADAARERMNETNNRIADAENTAAKNKIAVEGILRLIDSLKSNQEHASHESHQQLEALKAEEDRLLGEIMILEGENIDLRERRVALEAIESKAEETASQINSVKFQKRDKAQSLSRIKKTGSGECPHCMQEITPEHFAHIEEVLQGNLTELQAQIESLEAMYSAEKASYQGDMERIDEKLRSNVQTITEYNAQIKANLRHRSSILQGLEKAKSSVEEQLRQAQRDMDSIVASTQVILSRRKEDLRIRSIQEQIQPMLTDSGIKSFIIRQYLQLINNSINEALDEMEFPAVCTFDEKFRERVFIRHRDEVTYYALSQGERQRIDMAVMLALRKVASKIHGANSNMVILDETFDTSLDASATEYLLQALRNTGESVFIVSHRFETLADSSDRVIKVSKVGNFSELKID